jgi:hypothetical protein
MSALPPIAVIRQRIEHVCFVPEADMRRERPERGETFVGRLLRIERPDSYASLKKFWLRAFLDQILPAAPDGSYCCRQEVAVSSCCVTVSCTQQ